jgi:phenylacetate-CoA ligase
MHCWPEAGLIEVMADDSDEPVQPGQTGRFICTGILNSDMPLIRYEIGDRGALSDHQSQCSCQRTLPILQKIEGRLDDIILTPDGRKIGRLDLVFKEELCIQEAQIIQEDMSRIRVLVVPDSGYSEHDRVAIVQRLKERIGDLDISLETMNRIPRAANGKFRAVVSYVSGSESRTQ